ncbi:hypothetical protein [Acaryochloris sp. IP29b_bin.137]|uniref:hypothetical protein n=1 Tax=Acaryochloris sp. IP29b_bin.137 TaxID=2969217 RepID=UPI002618A345|nr:hypothetical protein [Acaryochloris sp. IP29b_bin.137]
MSYDFRYTKRTNEIEPFWQTMMATLKEGFKEWVRREIIDFDPYDDEGELIDFPEELRSDK